MLCIAEDINEDSISKYSQNISSKENYDLLGLRSDAEGFKELAVYTTSAKMNPEEFLSMKAKLFLH
jgi:hypothetical protein